MRRMLSVALASMTALAVAACAEQSPTGSDVMVVPMRSSSEAASLAGEAASASASARPSDHFHAAASSREEVPTNDSRARGNATFTLSEDGTTLTYKLITAGLENVTQAHIHIAPEGVNGPVVVFLFGFVAGGVTQNGVLAEGTITQAQLIARPAIGFGGTMAELVARIRSGNAYVNLHTVRLPGGEIRGQVK
ncbi:MAG: CHRD domain-containing protein [Gemmatimonadota bacterium]